MASSDTQNKAWAENKAGFGFKMLQKMGWGEGKGLGKKEDGMVAHIKIRKRQEHQAIGAQADYSGIAPLTSAMSDFNRLLAELHTTAAVGAAVVPPGGVASRTRAHSDASDAAAEPAAPPKQRRVAYGRVLRAKDVGRYSQSDLAAVLAGAAPAPAAPAGASAPPARKRSRSSGGGLESSAAGAPAPPPPAAASASDDAAGDGAPAAQPEEPCEGAAERLARKQAKRERKEAKEQRRREQAQQDDG